MPDESKHRVSAGKRPCNCRTCGSCARVTLKMKKKRTVCGSVALYESQHSTGDVDPTPAEQVRPIAMRFLRRFTHPQSNVEDLGA